MAKLDVEAWSRLKRRREDRQFEGRLGTWLSWDELDAIIVALEDRERLRAELQKCEAWLGDVDGLLEDRERLRAAMKLALRMYDDAAHGTEQQIDFEDAMDALEAALEGRDG